MPYVLVAGIFSDSMVVVITKRHEGATEEKKKLYKRLTLIR